MSKLKKALLISTYILIVGCAIALGVCYIVIPERTKWAMDTLIGYLNTPLGLVGGTTVTLGLVGGIIAKLLLERQRAKLTSSMAAYRNQVEQDKQELANREKALLERETIVNMYLASYDERIDVLTKDLVNVCETSPNAKIKAIGVKIVEKQSKINDELPTKVAIAKDYSEDKIYTLIDRLEKVEKEINSYGKERKETIND